MKLYFSNLCEKFNDFWVDNFVKKSNNLWALKVTVCIALVLIPVKFFGDAFIATTLALGIVAISLGETDVHPRGRLKSLASLLILLPFLSLCVELTIKTPFLFLIFLGIATFSLTLLGGRDSRFHGVTFGGLLIITYTMLGTAAGKPFYYQPLFFFVGSFFYSLTSLVLLYKKPYRILQEQLAYGYKKLAEYILLKSKLFPSLPSEQEELRNELALLNIEVFQQIEQIKKDLHSFTQESSVTSLSKIDKYYQKWFILQSLHERATSSHEQYDILSKETENIELIKGLGLLMKELSKALNLYAQSLLSYSSYEHPMSLEWTTKAMGELIENHIQENINKPIVLLYKNLKKIEETLKNVNKLQIQEEHKTVNQKINNYKVSINQLLKFNNSRFRYAVRLTLCIIVGYLITWIFNIDKGAWILLTSLIVCQQTYNATRQRIFKRIMGTFIGVISGVLIAKLIPTVEGQIIVLLISIYLFYYWLKSNYTIAVVFITIFVLEAFNLQSNKGLLVMTPRLIDTLIGASLVFFAVRFLWPDWQYKRLANHLRKAIEKNKKYFESVYDNNINKIEYLHNQRSAHRADNTLTTSWKGMKLEPKSKQKLITSARNLTYLNHSLISYISAFGVHKNEGFLSEKELLYCLKVSESLQQITQLWTDSIDSTYLEEIEYNEYLVNELRALRDANEGKNYIFIYNIAKVSRELFLETIDLLNSNEG
ncbi:FUSC family protein [Weeksellaceae bacterium TAE3-ERU29]|nr:FUSC family protein [Weeksellaceae bacterium TAE3-ERU29]